MNLKQLREKDWTAQCLACGETFKYADGFECQAQPGRHIVDSREFYHLGGAHIQSERDRRMYMVMLNLVPDLEIRDKVTGQITRIEGLIVHFREMGIYNTSDPLEQFHLDMHPAVVSGQEGREAWEKIYLTPQQQLAKAQAQLAETKKEIRENYALLDLTKQQKEEERRGMGMR